MSWMTRMLKFADFSRTNRARCESVFHPLHDWNPLEWAGAMCGEAGEAANYAKKLRRLDGADSALDTAELRESLADAIAEEAADAVTYADLLCQSVDRDLGEAVRRKFNKVSLERGAKERL